MRKVVYFNCFINCVGTHANIIFYIITSDGFFTGVFTKMPALVT